MARKGLTITLTKSVNNYNALFIEKVCVQEVIFALFFFLGKIAFKECDAHFRRQLGCLNPNTNLGKKHYRSKLIHRGRFVNISETHSCCCRPLAILDKSSVEVIRLSVITLYQPPRHTYRHYYPLYSIQPFLWRGSQPVSRVGCSYLAFVLIVNLTHMK